MQQIRVRGARTHNLKGVDLDLPRDRLIVLTGLSGSGKSSLAFDTLYAEGQRRYVESLSAYARQFLSMMDKPDVDSIEGLSPAIAIEQKATSHNPRSTVGTVTEIYDYLRLLFARAGIPRCPDHLIDLTAQTVSQMVDQVLRLPEGTAVALLAPLISDRKGEHAQVLEDLAAQGFVRVRIDGRIHDMDGAPKLDPKRKHTIEAVVDRTRVRAGFGTAARGVFRDRAAPVERTGAPHLPGRARARRAGFLQQARLSCLRLQRADARAETVFVQQPGRRLPHLRRPGHARSSSIPTGSSSIRICRSRAARCAAGIGATRTTSNSSSRSPGTTSSTSRHPGPSSRPRFRRCCCMAAAMRPLNSATRKARRPRRKRHPFEGILPNLERRYRETESATVREELAKYLGMRPCPDCGGTRLNNAARFVFVAERSLPETAHMTVGKALDFFDSLNLAGWRGEVATKIAKDVAQRLHFLVDVGLDYLTLDRSAETLSGGEAQRIRLASQVGSGLTGVMYILDEPSIGLHQRDNQRLLGTLKRLRDIGNTVIVVEHDEEAILEADYVVDLGPGAGVHGGEIVAQGTPREIQANPASITGQYLSGKRQIALPRLRTPPSPDKQIRIVGATGNNLRNVTADIPVGLLTCVTGVSGSGKSTLIIDTLFGHATSKLNGTVLEAAPCERVEGLDKIDRVIDIDQSPIGRTPRSNPATYTGLFAPLREIFAAVPEARARGYDAGRFSFNVKGGRCEACQGDGVIKVEMHFLPDVYVPCDVCKGQRYNRETLEIRYRGKNIYEVLDMTVEDALRFFQNIPAVAGKLQTLTDVGLSYVRLGQNATTLSGGEAQRVKLARELAKRATGRTLYILDEPTTGLHFQDVAQLLDVLHRLRDEGNTIVVIEHNLDVIKTADWVIDMGPEGGSSGGEIVAKGTPEDVAATQGSHTGDYLRPLLERTTARRSGAAGG